MGDTLSAPVRAPVDGESFRGPVVGERLAVPTLTLLAGDFFWAPQSEYTLEAAAAFGDAVSTTAALLAVGDTLPKVPWGAGERLLTAAGDTLVGRAASEWGATGTHTPGEWRAGAVAEGAVGMPVVMPEAEVAPEAGAAAWVGTGLSTGAGGGDTRAAAVDVGDTLSLLGAGAGAGAACTVTAAVARAGEAARAGGGAVGFSRVYRRQKEDSTSARFCWHRRRSS